MLAQLLFCVTMNQLLPKKQGLPCTLLVSYVQRKQPITKLPLTYRQYNARHTCCC